MTLTVVCAPNSLDGGGVEGFGVWGLGCGVWGVGCVVWVVGCGEWGVRCGVWGVGCGVLSSHTPKMFM